ncbi:sigma-70 family RNA polymerase sigma factor [Mycolicibacterium phlei]|jgi:RNA polymerase sigma-70 factor (ECF subfamily)|uniref:RNA polymerase sigma factor n=1 Tax=Mycolicibacterium phlei DSM 43239 = CCUG 21000 TaxID=1226750 RepID=A0A5N5UY21_MYCPH|nr:sigma-70 family RNA polymerase sigma factor [Mycolicibacterium phlei]EID09456.1 RNA polymerase factor sigma-70 [Mycolicibacterium phlei RIVM601174]KAB7754511.1 RNA polymerase sigma70 factor [Mycolicibacterium phlei DSM 43239 = CCUG 21000]KXW65157.1 RNA polymerase sigma70 factor [Mycolicibacterium phlei DSM 43239 = CCUG 21000]KXW75062.1 RNA polymerase factor sigma-70 [Mycolicibacterium phlei DSM 43071]MBF4194920.1 RNA polymerase factor sigma-70 [Mycolicibacterium phlei]
MSAGVVTLGDMTVLARDVDGGSAEDAFLAEAQRYRRELLAHCYRMTGSLHDAEDLVQETYLRAWKSYKGFEGKSSVRTWLYRIATNTALTALESRQRRPLPSGLGTPSSDPTDDIVARHEVPWLEPLPDDAADPSTIVGSRESVRLAFVAALQHLSPRQRAVLVLREVLQWKAAEVAEAVGCSTAAVNSLLQRARAQLDAVGLSEDDELRPPDSPEAQDLLTRYIAAFESYDVDQLVELFTDDAVWEMPPFDGWYRGPHDIVLLSKTHCPAEGPGDMRFIRTTANGQPAAALYMLNRDTGRHEPFQMHVLAVGAEGITHVVAFHVTTFEPFGLPAHL